MTIRMNAPTPYDGWEFIVRHDGALVHIPNCETMKEMCELYYSQKDNKKDYGAILAGLEVKRGHYRERCVEYMEFITPPRAGEKDYNAIIDRLIEIRARNNNNWMGLFRLAITNPATRPEAIKLAKQIFNCDHELLEVAKELYE